VSWLAIADDLTGAAETAAEWTGSGAVTVWWTPPNDGDRTPSVLLAPVRDPGIGDQLADWRRLARAGFRMAKIDSLLRGPWAFWLAELWRLTGRSRLALAPALPELDRVTAGGRVRWRGRVLEATSVGAEVRSSRLLDYFPHALGAVLMPGDAVPGTANVVAVDAWESRHLDEALASLGETDVLWAGARALAASLARRGGAPPPPPALVSPVADGRVLLVAGSRSEPGLAQWAAVEEAPGIPVVGTRVPKQPGIWAVAPPVSFQELGAWCRSLDPVAFDAVILNGGATALSWCLAAGASGLEVLGRLPHGAVLARLQGGPAHGQLAVIKAGSAGGEEALTELASMLMGGGGGE
jgi:uncharacterized protein YgbK (DUF1537 family)